MKQDELKEALNGLQSHLNTINEFIRFDVFEELEQEGAYKSAYMNLYETLEGWFDFSEKEIQSVSEKLRMASALDLSKIIELKKNLEILEHEQHIYCELLCLMAELLANRGINL